MDFELPREIYERGKVIQVDETKNVHIIIGENSSGKSKLMDVVKNKIGVNKVKIIAENINSIENINAIDKEEVHKRSYRGKGVEQIVSLVNANDTIRTLIFHWFEKLFNKKIKKEGSQYQITENGKNYPLNLDGDGYKCFFNLIYSYLPSLLAIRHKSIKETVCNAPRLSPQGNRGMLQAFRQLSTLLKDIFLISMKG